MDRAVSAYNYQRFRVDRPHNMTAQLRNMVCYSVRDVIDNFPLKNNKLYKFPMTKLALLLFSTKWCVIAFLFFVFLIFPLYAIIVFLLFLLLPSSSSLSSSFSSCSSILLTLSSSFYPPPPPHSLVLIITLLKVICKPVHSKM